MKDILGEENLQNENMKENRIIIYPTSESTNVLCNNKVITYQNPKNYCFQGRIIDYELFIKCLLTIIKQNKLKFKQLLFFYNSNYKKIDKEVLSEVFEKLNIVNVSYIKLNRLFNEFEKSCLIIKESEYSNIIYKKNNIILEDF